MYVLGVFCMVGMTVALPVLPNPPTLPFSISAALQNQKVSDIIPEADIASSPVEENSREVKANIIRIYRIFIPPPPELPPFDYSTLKKQNVQRVRSDDSFEPEADRSVEVKEMKPLIAEESKTIKNSKSEERGQSVWKPNSIEEFKSIEESKSAEKPLFAERPEPISVEEAKSAEKPVFVERPEPISVEESKSVDESKSVEGPEANSVEESKSMEEPNSAEQHKIVEYSDSTKVEPTEEPQKPLEDIPVVIQFTVPTTSFLSSIFSKLTSLASFGLSWPFHIPSFFNRPRSIYPIYDGDYGIYPNQIYRTLENTF